ncbi:hypothetical protein AYK87_06910 [Stutzerimonas stutzeri]|nr:hypothetical protein AYK87_06910 [Stutzerimonas stutzeri]
MGSELAKRMDGVLHKNNAQRADALVTTVSEGHAPPCQQCVMSGICLPSVLAVDDLPTDQTRLRTLTLAKGQVLFEAGQQATSLYVVRSGTIGTTSPNHYGVQQILFFSLGGDLVGASALHEDEYQTSARAVQRTALCEFPKELLLQSSEANGGLVRFLRRALSKELNSIRCARLQLATPRADTRVASFVAWYASALAERRLAANRFHLPMSRVEIANHLGLAVESVSRALADLRAEDVLETHGREVQILDSRRLRELACSKQFRRPAGASASQNCAASAG